jgi:hypothetical protein
MPIHQRAPKQANKSNRAVFGVHVNAHSTGFYTSNIQHFSWLDNWVSWGRRGR